MTFLRGSIVLTLFSLGATTTLSENHNTQIIAPDSLSVYAKAYCDGTGIS